MSERDRHYMRLALREALKGRGKTSPNPCVGAVVVQGDVVVGRGWHRRAGTAHAEVNALAAAGEAARGAELFVTLEPCNHSGKTPPCTAAVLAAGIRRVVVGMEDPNPAVRGGGGRLLAAHGVEFTSGVLAEDCAAINRPFLKYCQTGMPWVLMKAAMSLDGRIAAGQGQRSTISNDAALKFVHRLRHRVDAVLVGIDTVVTDDPLLTARIPGGRDPLRVVLDSTLRLSSKMRLFRQSSTAGTVVFCTENASADRIRQLEESGARVSVVPGDADRVDLRKMLRQLGSMGVGTLLVEGGAKVHASFLRQGLYDHGYLVVAPIFIGDGGVPLLSGFGAADPLVRSELVGIRRLEDNVVMEIDFSAANKAFVTPLPVRGNDAGRFFSPPA